MQAHRRDPAMPAAAASEVALADHVADPEPKHQQQQPPPPPAPALASLPFRPRVMTLGHQHNQQQQQHPLPPRLSIKKRPAPSDVKAPSSTSTLWRRHAHGSYQHYYFRRKSGSGQKGGTADARLAVLKEKWFRGKALLDIGTNTGKVAWEIYQRFQPARMVGVDIDAELIATARTKLGHACRRDGVDHARAVTFECCDIVGVGGRGGGGGQDDNGAAATAAEGEGEAAVDVGIVGGEAKYDVITCLSVTKHVHLQGGDAALLRLFRRVHRLLRPGGRFVLEPQPWRSYRKRKNASTESARHYAALRLRPPFVDALLGPGVGFAAVEALGVPPDAAEGYRRPVYCFVKAGGGEESTGGG